MFIHLGEETTIMTSDIIGIFDIDNCSVEKNTRVFLRAAQKEGRIIDVSGELPKAFVVCGDKKVFFSQLSPATLKKRAGNILLNI